MLYRARKGESSRKDSCWQGRSLGASSPGQWLVLRGSLRPEPFPSLATASGWLPRSVARKRALSRTSPLPLQPPTPGSTPWLRVEFRGFAAVSRPLWVDPLPAAEIRTPVRGPLEAPPGPDRGSFLVSAAASRLRAIGLNRKFTPVLHTGVFRLGLSEALVALPLLVAGGGADHLQPELHQALGFGWRHLGYELHRT